MIAFKVLFFSSICLASAKANVFIEEEKAYTVCRNVRIWDLSGRNLENELKALQKCQIIEGYLDIRDVTLNSSTSFPKLIQVTDYVVLHYVKGVNSVAELFPLLSVIRGRNLFFDYGLVLIDNHDLREIGPWSLKVIKRGGIRLESNVLMCINSRAELERIAHKDYKDKIFLYKNYDICIFEDCLEENWCSALERTCMDFGCYNDTECHKECLGGCKCHNNSSCCAACEHFLMGEKCVSQCPKYYLTYMNYRCITHVQCLKYGWAIHENVSKNVKREGRCIPKCPAGFVKRNGTGICEPRKAEDWCDGTTITNTNLGSNLKGCSVIKGNLIIMVTGGRNVTRQLEENFASLETITGYLRVVGANALLSLNFLKNLKNIEGTEVAHDGCVLCIFENSNLEELWNWESKDSNLIINGALFIAFNDHLCPAEVEKLLTKNNRTSNNSVIQSNGKNTNCNIFFTPLTVVAGNTPGTVNLSFYHYWCGVDSRTFVGYAIYYRESPTNISIYEGRDICSNEILKMRYFETEYDQENGTCLNYYSLENLKPNTRYAVYAKSFATDNIAVHTNLAYVTTYPLRPSAPRNGSIDVSENYLRISFEESIDPVSDGGFYEIFIDLKTMEAEKDLRHHGSCLEEAATTNSIPNSFESVENDLSSNDSDSNCLCSLVSPESVIMKRREQIAVENEILSLYHRLEEEPERTSASGPLKESQVSNKPANNGDNVAALCNKNKRVPSGLCSTPIFNWTKGDDDKLKFTELSNRHNWTDFEPSMVMESLENSLIIALPSHLKTPTKIEVKVRACLGRMTPCHILNSSASCALCSDFYKALSYKVEKIPPLKNFKVTPRIFDEFGKELYAIYTETDCKVDHSYSSNDGTKNRLQLEISWDYSPHYENLVHGYKILYNFSEEVNSTCLSKLSADELENKLKLEVEQPREYSVAMFIKTAKGFEKANEICMHIKNYNIYEDLYWVSAAAVLTVLLVTVLLIYRNVIQKIPNINKNDVIEFKNPNYGDPFLKEHGIEVEFQITDDMLQIFKNQTLGEGKFGIVYKGILSEDEKYVERKEVKKIKEFHNIFKNLLTSCKKKPKHEVACKTFVFNDKLKNQMAELLDEARKAITCIKSEFIVKIFGVYREMKDPRSVYIIYELMDRDLENYLKENEAKGLSDNLMAEICIQIGDGMAFLGAHNLTHRDISARNILISISSNSKSIIWLRAKISDFGMARRLEDGYYKFIGSDGKVRPLPVRWLSPESIHGNIYNWRTDVWSYGVLLWEIMYNGKKPYEHIAVEIEVYERRKSGDIEHHLECPNSEEKPNFLIEMMRNCMAIEPKKRPSFKHMVEMLLQRVTPEFRKEFLNLSWYKINKASDTNSSEGKDEGVHDCSFNASLDEEDQPSSSTISCQPCDDTSYSSLTQEESSAKNMSCLSLQCGT